MIEIPKGLEYSEAAQHYSVHKLVAYDAKVAAGIGALMPQLDETFSGDPVPQAKLERIINSPDRAQLVAVDAEGQVVGAASMNTLMGAGKQDEGWLEDFIVAESARGTTVAEQLWQAMGDWTRRRGMAQFSFGTETWRPAAVRFYEKHGAQTDPTPPHLTYKVDQ